MPQPLGIRFKPDEQQALMGKQQAGREGLQQAIQLLSLRYPRVTGARSIVGDPALLGGQGGPSRGFNPDAAIMQAMIQALATGQTPDSVMPTAPAGRPRTPVRPGVPRPTPAPRRPPAPRSPSASNTRPSFTPGIDQGDAIRVPTVREWDVPQGTIQHNPDAGVLEPALRRTPKRSPDQDWGLSGRGFL